MKLDVLPIVLAAAAFGLALLPIAAIVGASDAAVIGLGTAYGTVVGVVAPLIARRSRNGGGDRNGSGDPH